MKRYNCFVCRHQNHSFHECGIVKCFYTVTPVADSIGNVTQQRANNTSTNCTTQARQPTTSAANLSSLPITVTDTLDRYDGFADMRQHQSVPNPDNTAYGSPVNTDTHVVDNTTDSTVARYLYKFCRGSAKRVKYSTHIDPHHFFTHSTSTLLQCVVNSGATHHMWNDPTAFISFH